MFVRATAIVVEGVGRCEPSRFSVFDGTAQHAMSIDGGLNWEAAS